MIADIIAQDSRGRDVLVVVVKGRQLEQDIVDRFFESIDLECPTVPFAMIVDVTHVYVKKKGHERRPGTYCVLDSADVFRHYDPDFGSMRVFQDYLSGLTEIWLLELALRRESETPPGMDALNALGLLERLEGGGAKREVPIGVDALR